jgi:hypothetical protein
MAGLDLDFHTAQVEELAKAKAEAAAAGLLLMDTTPAMLLRPVRPLAAPERDAVQRLRPLVPARTDRRLERDAPAGPNLIPHPYAYCSPCS